RDADAVNATTTKTCLDVAYIVPDERRYRCAGRQLHGASHVLGWNADGKCGENVRRRIPGERGRARNHRIESNTDYGSAHLASDKESANKSSRAECNIALYPAK